MRAAESRSRPSKLASRGTRFPPFVMDRPILHPLVAALADSEELDALASALPETSARVSEPALPLLLAALHARLGRRLLCLLPDDEDARDAAEAAAWFAGADSVAFMPGRGVTAESGLRVPPHLVGERLRALSVLANGGLVCMSATAAAEGLPPWTSGRRRSTIAVGSGERAGGADRGACARRLRARRACGRAWAGRRSRGDSRHLRHDGPRADPRRVLRRRRRRNPRVLGVHAAGALRPRAGDDLSGGGAQGRPPGRRRRGVRDRRTCSDNRPRLETGGGPRAVEGRAGARPGGERSRARSAT